MLGQIAANASFVRPLDHKASFAHLQRTTRIVNTEMISTINAWHMVQTIANAPRIVYPDAGQGARVQYPDTFLKHAVQLLDA